MSNRAVWIALFVSLALNVFVGGALVGAHLTGARLQLPQPAQAEGPRPELGRRNPIMAAVRTLAPEHQTAWRASMPNYGQTYGPKVREARQLAREAMARLGDQGFDQAAVLADLKRARALEHESRSAMDERLVAFAASLPPAERAKFAEALSRPPPRRAPVDR